MGKIKVAISIARMQKQMVLVKIITGSFLCSLLRLHVFFSEILSNASSNIRKVIQQDFNHKPTDFLKVIHMLCCVVICYKHYVHVWNINFLVFTVFIAAFSFG
jgi:hypothetical protein